MDTVEYPGLEPCILDITATILKQNAEILKINTRLLTLATTVSFFVKGEDK